MSHTVEKTKGEKAEQSQAVKNRARHTESLSTAFPAAGESGDTVRNDYESFRWYCPS